MNFNLDGNIEALVLKFSVTNINLIPAGAFRTESKSHGAYVERSKRVMGVDDETVAANGGNPGFQSPETKFGRVGLNTVEALMNRFLRIEYRVVPKPNRITKYAIMFFFVLNDKDMHAAVPMSSEHMQALRWFALQTFEGCRIWNNGARIVIDLVQRQSQKKALHHIHFQSTQVFCWAPLGANGDSESSPIQPQFLTQEYVTKQRIREAAFSAEGERSLQRLFDRAERGLANSR